MSVRRSSLRVKPVTTPKETFLGRLLDPIDRLSETIYSILILLTFTLAFRIFKLGIYSGQPVSAEYVNELLIAAVGAILAWGMIDGLMYALTAVFERGERHRLLQQIHAAQTDQVAVDALAAELDHILEPITGENQRQNLYLDILEHLRHGRPQPVGLQREDFAGAFGSVLVAIVAVLPSLVPLVLLRGNYELAIRASNVVSFLVLFVAGYRWGQHTGANPWKTGILLAAVGLIMVMIAIPLGG